MDDGRELRDSSPVTAQLASPFVAESWRRVRIEVRPSPLATAESTHTAALFVGEQKVVEAWPICSPAGPQRVLRLGLAVTGTVKPVAGWAARIDDVVFFAR